MRKYLDPGMRLIIVFILTVIVSGGILTYLSISNISNFKELTNKKISEEQEIIADRVSISFWNKLEEVSDRFTAQVMKEEKIDWEALKLSDSLELISKPYVLDREMEFLWPWYLEHSGITKKLSSTALPRKFRQAERIEFQTQDYQSAAVYYQASLRQSSNKSDSVMALNALGRVYLKMNNYDQAYTNYNRITSSYHSVLDHNGFPYVYYAVLNLLKFPDSSYRSTIYDEINSFLLQLKDGTIPLCISTEEVLAQIKNWSEESQLSDELLQKLKGNITMTMNRIQFIQSYGEVIRQSLAQGMSPDQSQRVGDFKNINGITDENDKIFLVVAGQEYSVGFVMELKEIWSSIMKSDYSEYTEFAYEIKLVERKGNDVTRSSESGVSTEFSSFVPEYMAWISLKDIDLVDTYVKRRSWTYGIALVLLLGAMFLGILLIMRDILREKYLSHLRSNFVSNVTHELKTPLTSIHLFAESVLLGRVETESGQKEYLQIILNETKRLKRMINNILDFSKKEQGRIDYKTEKVNVSELIVSALQELNYWLVEMNFTVHTELEEGVHMSGDYDSLKQVVINLLDNAIKYSGNQKEISIRLAAENNKIRIEFSDKGIGIPEDQLDSIFEKFFRVNDNMVDGIGGTGLGLTVVKEIVEAHQGEILVKSELKKGSIFTVLLNSS